MITIPVQQFTQRPDTTFGSHFDGVNYYFFESDVERETYMAQFIDVLAINKSQIEEAVDLHVKQILTDNWYTGIGEVGAIASTPNDWQAEAQAILAQYIAIYQALEEYKENVTEQTMLTPEQFLATIV